MKHTRAFLAAFLICILACTTVSAQDNAELPPQPTYSPEQALALLREGNQRFIKGNSVYPNQTSHQRKVTAIQGQKPFATVIACSDSRVVPALIFDRGLGDLFVIRNLGNVAGSDTLASVEYSMLALDTPLLVVLGNTDNTIIKAAAEGTKVNGHMMQLLGKLKPAVKMAKTIYPDIKGEELVNKAVETNVRQVMRDILGQCPQILEKVRAGKAQVMGAVYDMDKGKIIWLGP